ncbi:MAG: Putative beta-lactamase HcpC [Rhodobiaceae bacterium UBA7378]|nr:MAG: Putative beta-lactamase HcpC [Rhodobiaceae bacterium UBA7378]|tara:strand:+ start:457 stop:1092 length:636 start_codon:yes stop_codon:yes gene_type:complete
MPEKVQKLGWKFDMFKFGVFAKTILIAFVVSTGAVANNEEDGHDLFRRGLYEEAIGHWEMAAKQGDADAAYRLSVEYSNAIVVKRDMKKAFDYLQQAANDDHPAGLQDLASLYDEGIFFVKQDRERAAQLYLKAARLGNSAAMFNAASILERGEAGVAQDRIEAYKYYVLSRDAGFYPLAVEALMDLSAVMSPDELAEAEIRAEQFKPALK